MGSDASSSGRTSGSAARTRSSPRYAASRKRSRGSSLMAKNIATMSRMAEAFEVAGAVFADRYRIVAPLGKGGMGTVVRALDLSMNREITLKVAHKRLDAERL